MQLDENQSFLFSMYAEDSDFALIPKQLIPTTELTFEQKLVLGVLFNRARKPSPVFPTHEEFSELLNLPKKQIFIAIKSLKKLRILENESVNFSRKSVEKNHEFIIFSKKNQKSLKLNINLSERSEHELIFNVINLSERSEHELITTHKNLKISPARKQTAAKSKKTFPESKLIEYWNSLPNTRKHKLPASKVYQGAMKYFRAMKNGTFDTVCELDKSSFVTPKSKWTDKEIMKAMHNVALLFTEGYWPENKNFIPKDLKTLLYNPRTQKSLFHNYAYTPPQKIVVQKLDDDEHEFATLFDVDSLSVSEMIRIQTGIKKIHEFYQTIPNDESGQVAYWYPTFERLCKAYVNWLLDQDWIDEIHVGAINTSSKLWGKFISAQKNELGIQLT